MDNSTSPLVVPTSICRSSCSARESSSSGFCRPTAMSMSPARTALVMEIASEKSRSTARRAVGVSPQ